METVQPLRGSNHYKNGPKFKSLILTPRTYIQRIPKVSQGRVLLPASSKFKSLVLTPNSYINRTPNVSQSGILFPLGSKIKSSILTPSRYIERMPKVSEGRVLPPIGSKFKSLAISPDVYIKRTPKVAVGKVLFPAGSRFRSLIVSPKIYIDRIPKLSEGRVLFPGSSPNIQCQNRPVRTQTLNRTTVIRDSLRRAAARLLCVPDLKTTRVDVVPLYPETVAPKEWKIKGNDVFKHYHLTEVKQDTKEFEDIDKLFHKTMSSTKIKSLKRIENGALWTAYCQKKDHMRQKLGMDVEERQLFHGTNSDNIKPISKQGFDFRFHGKAVGTKHGKGSYFSTKADYSDSYTVGHKMLFVALTLVGEFSKGDPSYVRPPPKRMSELGGDLFDSCVNDVINPTIFVIFDNHQVYPQYLIAY